MADLPPPIRVAVIGTGGWAGHHARVFAGRPDVELCGILGRDRERTQKRATAYRTRGFTHLIEMLEEARPELISICLPNLLHYQTTLRVIEAGFPLLVEKPLVFDLAEADRLLAEAERRSLFFGINFNHRYSRPVRQAREAIAKGRLGQLVFMTWRFGGEGNCAHHPLANLIETQCHGFDLLEYLAGPIVSICGDAFEKQGHSTVSLSLKFANGAVGNFLGTYDSSYAYRGAQRLEINGTRGRALIEDTVRRFEFQAADSELAEVWEAGFFNDWDREFQRTFDSHVEDLLGAFRRGEPPPVPTSAGQRALLLAHSAAQAIADGCRVAVPLPRGPQG